MNDRDVDVTTGERDKFYTHRLFQGVLPNFTFPMPFFSLENQELGSALATDMDVDVTAGERDKCYTHRLFHGVLHNFSFRMPPFNLENQELGSPLATGRDVDITTGEREIIVTRTDSFTVFYPASPSLCRP